LLCDVTAGHVCDVAHALIAEADVAAQIPAGRRLLDRHRRRQQLGHIRSVRHRCKHRGDTGNCREFHAHHDIIILSSRKVA
jgi:hypothetical protein